MFYYLYFCPTNLKLYKTPRPKMGKHIWECWNSSLWMCVDVKDTLPICSQSHALALGCEPKAKVVEFVPSIEKLWNDKHAYCLVKGFFWTITKARHRGPRFGRVKTWSQNKSNTYLLYSSLWVLLPLARVY
jgi:hypothetical protein